MGAVGFVGRAELRRRWGSVIVLTLLVGLVAAVVLASLAGARRTSSAFTRFQAETLAPDLTIFIPTVDEIVQALAEGLRPGDRVAILSNGGFGGIHDKLLRALEAAALR